MFKMAASMTPVMAPIYLILASILLLFCITQADAAKLNAPKVLLPYYSSVITNYTLQVEYSPEEAQVGNCYRWRSTRPEVAQVQLVNSTDGTCAQTAIVSAISKTSHQMTTVILAENKVTGEILRTNVIVSEIVKVEIETTTRLLYLEDSPEELIARGYDSEGNIFSNLEGLSFEWNLISDNETGHDVVDAHNILRIKRFTDSHYITPHHIAPLEDKGMQGDMILVEGIRTGSAKVSARLKDPVYKGVRPSEVRIMVIANLMLSPPDAYVLRFGRVKYRVELLRHNSLKEIKMPSKQYYLSIKDEDICRLDAQNSMATALLMGSTEVLLNDRNIVVTEFFRQPSAMIHVVAPGFLAFVVLPHRKWVLETDREYEILIEIYDTDSHKIYPSDNVRVVAEFPQIYFKVLFSSVNGTYHRVRTLLKGETVIDGALVSIITEDGSEYAITPEIKRSQDVEIYDPVNVTPSQVFFPWDPISRCVHKFQAQATGGSGDYIWSATDSTVASVNIKGQITTVGPGKCNVTAADAKNSAHFGVSSMQVLPPADMSFPLSPVEAAIGTSLDLPLAVFARVNKKLHAFSDCRQLPLNISFSDPSVFEHIPDGEQEKALPDTGCTTLTFLAKRQGHTELTITFRSYKQFLQTSVTIAAFNPLKPVDPEMETVVALGSTKEVVFRGGPQPWVLDSSKFFQTLTPEKEALIKTEKQSALSINRGIHVFAVQCRDFGEQEIHLSVGNGKTAKNQFPLTETASIRFVCARPVELHLQPVLNLNPNLPPCPVTHENHLPMPVHCSKDLDLLVTVTDSSGRRFDNFSSLAVEWTVSSSNLAELLHLKELRQDIDVQTDGKKLVSSYQTMRPYGKRGSVVISASINRYKTPVIKSFGKSQGNITPVISKSLELQLVEEAVLSPATVSVFNHPSNQVTIGIHHGSGYFHVEDVHSEILKAKFEQKSKSVLVTPLKDGSHSFTVYDLCLDVTSHPLASVSVSGVGSIQVAVIDKVEVLKEVQAEVKVLDVRGQPLLASFFSLMGLKLEAASDIVQLRLASADSQDRVTGVYTVHGAIIGHTTLSASVRLPSGQVIYSAPKPLEVFPPLRLEPKNVTLIVGATLQVLAFGGPQPQSNVEFSILDSRVSTITAGGILEAMEVGGTRVLGRAVGTDSITGEKVIYSQDDAIVNVVILKGIRIHAPLTRLQTGTTMPVYAVGLTEQETPFSFGNSVPPLSFSWSVNSREVLHLQSVYHKSGIHLSPINNFAQQAVAKETGHATLRLHAEPTSDSGLQVYRNVALNDQVQIQVFEKLALVNPPVCNGQVRVTPNTDMFLRTNRDVAARVHYFIEPENWDAPVVRLLDSGQLRSGPIPGSAVLRLVAEEEFGLNQSLVILVKVKPVSFLMINAETPIHTSTNHLSVVPIGATLQFSVSYHDDVGDEFYATNTQLGIRCSRYDLLHVSNGGDNDTLIVRAAEIGSTILKVWDKRNPSMADYVNIPVGYAIEPTQAVITLGSLVCFSSPVVTESGRPGQWQSKSRPVQMNQHTGVATASTVGKSVIVYSFSPLTSTKTEVTVEAIETLSIAPGVSYLSNTPVKGKDPFFAVTFREGGNIIGPNCSSVIIQHESSPSYIPYQCHLELTQKISDISVSDLFVAKPVFDVEKALHGCQVSQVDVDLSSQRTAILGADILLYARVPATLGQPEVNSLPLTLEFLPAFYIHNTEIHLTTASPLSTLRVSSTPKVLKELQVTGSDSIVLQVLTPESDPQSPSVILYPIKLLESLTLWEREHHDLAVEIVHVRTGFKVRVPVFVMLIGQQPDSASLRANRQELNWAHLLTPSTNSYQSWFVICFIMLITAAVVLVAYHAFVGPKYRTTASSNVFLNQSGVQTPSPSPSPSSHFLKQSTPIGTPSFTNRSSPTSPKLWSVSYNQQDTASPYKRNPYPFSTKS